MTQLAAQIGNLECLKTLTLSGFERLEMLPYSIGRLTALQTLDLSVCEGLTVLPESIGKLTALASLRIAQAPEEIDNPEEPYQGLPPRAPSRGRKELPTAIGNLRGMRTLFLEDPAFTTLPLTFWALTGLTELSIDLTNDFEPCLRQGCAKVYLPLDMFAQADTLPLANHYAVFVGRVAHQSTGASSIYHCFMNCVRLMKVLVS